jgi:hypothetical protein
MVSLWCQCHYGVSMMSVLYQYGVSVVSVWCQYDVCIVSVWCQCGVSMVSIWCQCGKCDGLGQPAFLQIVLSLLLV